MIGVIKEKKVGVCYQLSVYHIGVAFIHEKQDWSTYGGSFKVEHSHRTGAVHIEAMIDGQGDFGSWLRSNPDRTSGHVDSTIWPFLRKKRVVDFAFAKLSEAYAEWLSNMSKKVGAK